MTLWPEYKGRTYPDVAGGYVCVNPHCGGNYARWRSHQRLQAAATLKEREQTFKRQRQEMVALAKEAGLDKEWLREQLKCIDGTEKKLAAYKPLAAPTPPPCYALCCEACGGALRLVADALFKENDVIAQAWHTRPHIREILREICAQALEIDDSGE